MKITFKDLTIHTISNASGLFSGTNIHSGFRSEKKKNEGNGTVVGNENVLMNNRHVVQKQENERTE